MHKKIGFIVIFIILIFVLVQCSKQDNQENKKEEIINPEVIEPELPTLKEETSEKLIKDKSLSLSILSIKNPIQITPIFLNTYEDIYIYYSMLEEAKNNLLDKCIEFFLSIDIKQINQKGFSKYYGELGRDLIKECQRFKMVFYIGTGEKDLLRHFYREHEFYVHNESYYQLGKDLLEIEKSLDNSDYENALNYIKAVYENIIEIREKENEGKDI